MDETTIDVTMEKPLLCLSGGMNDHAGAIFKGFQRLFRLQHYIAFGRPTRHLGTFAGYPICFYILRSKINS